MRRGLIILAAVAACAEAPLAALPPVRDAEVACIRDDMCPSPMVCRAGLCTFADAGVPDAANDAGLAGQIVVDPEEIDFGAFRFGEPVERTVTITNAGNASLYVLQAMVEQNTLGEFELLGADGLPSRLPPNERIALRVRYTAADGRPDTDRLQISSDDPARPLLNVPLTAELKGIARLTVVEDEATESPAVTNLDFAPTAVGTARARTLYIKNVGMGASLLEVTGVSFLSAAAELTVTTTVTSGFLNRGDSLAVNLAFEPSAAADFEGTLVIESSDADRSPYEIVVRGTGIEASLAVTPDPIAFGQVFVGFPRAIDLVLSNIGSAPLDVTSVQVVGVSTEVAVTSTAPLTLGPGARSFARVMVDPVAPGAVAESVRVVSTDPDQPTRDVHVTATAIAPPQLVVTPVSVDFGDVHIFNAASAFEAASVTIENQGSSDLTVSLVVTGAAEFSAAPGSLAPIPPQGAATIDVRYAPTVVGAHAAVLQLTTNDPAASVFDIPLSGNAIDPDVLIYKSTPPAVPASPIDFGQVPRGESSAPVTVFVDNGGTGTLVLTSVSLTGGGAAEFLQGSLPMLPAAIVPGSGAGISFTVQYTPSNVGNDSAAVVLVTNDRDAPMTTLTLIGEGVPCAPNQYDINMDPSDGCEYACVRSTPPTEVCNGADDDCDGTTDEACPSGITFGALQAGTEFGGTGGSPFSLACPAGQVMVGIAGRSGSRVDRIQPLCAALSFEVDASGSPEHVYRVRRGTVSAGAVAGGTGGTAFSDLCPGERVVVGIRVRHAAEVDLIQAVCGALTIARGGGGWLMSVSSPVDTPSRGGGGGNASAFSCASGGAGTRLHGRAGARIDRLAMDCTSVDLVLR